MTQFYTTVNTQKKKMVFHNMFKQDGTTQYLHLLKFVLCSRTKYIVHMLQNTKQHPNQYNPEKMYSFPM